MSRGGVVVAGVAESPLGQVDDLTELGMCALAAREALGEAGMTVSDVDGVFTAAIGDLGPVLLAEHLGIAPRYLDGTDLGGSAFEAHVHHALLALEAGRCEVALVAYASRQRSRRGRDLARTGGDAESWFAQFEAPFGLPAPVGRYALAAARHVHEHGTTPEQLAQVAVAARAWAQRNPKAWSRDPLTVEDCLASAPIALPLRRSDCCLVTDGGGALVLTTAERGRDAAKRCVRVLGAGEAATHRHITQAPSLTETAGATSAREAFATAGITAADVDVLEPYDSFTITVLLALEDLGFCARGEAGAFVEDGRLAPGGSLPAMTSGGGLSYCHPGHLGLLLLVEAVRQLRGEAGERQVPGDPEIAVCHGVGGYLSSAATVVLAR